jgi:hypothetical protein
MLMVSSYRDSSYQLLTKPDWQTAHTYAHQLAMSRLSMFGGTADASKPPAAASSSSRFSIPAISSPSSSAASPPPPPSKQRQPSYIASQLTNLSISGPPAPPPLTSIMDRPVNRMRGAEVGMAAWAFLYSGIVAYSQSRVDSVVELEKR